MSLICRYTINNTEQIYSQVPRQLGEVAAFGGSNIEPSVRSCFEQASAGTKDGNKGGTLDRKAGEYRYNPSNEHAFTENLFC